MNRPLGTQVPLPKIRVALKALLERLPTFDSLSADDSDGEARAALAILVKYALEAEVGQAVSEDSSTCPNCGVSLVGNSSPYCGQTCRDRAAFIRQFRRCLLEESSLEPDRLASLGQVFWHVLGGGYPRRQTLVTEKERKRIFSRYEGRCQVCGAPATTFDHIGSACNRTSNLRSVCEQCTQTRPFGEAAFLSRPETKSLLAELAQRIGNPAPVRICDDPDAWDWREYVKRRRAASSPVL